MFFVGVSHIVCLGQAANARGVVYDSLNLWGCGRPVIYGVGPPHLNPALEAKLGEHVISTVGGSAHDMAGLAQHPRLFDLVLPEAPDLPLSADAEIIPYAGAEAGVRALIDDEQLDLIANAGYGELVLRQLGLVI